MFWPQTKHGKKRGIINVDFFCWFMWFLSFFFVRSNNSNNFFGCLSSVLYVLSQFDCIQRQNLTYLNQISKNIKKYLNLWMFSERKSVQRVNASSQWNKPAFFFSFGTTTNSMQILSYWKNVNKENHIRIDSVCVSFISIIVF